MKKLIFIFFSIFAALPVFAQTYNPKVSKDSLGILNARVEVLKSSIKVLELKIKESEEEADVEKLRLKLLEANGNAKSSSEKNSGNISNNGSVIDSKAVEKLSKKAKSDDEDAKKALDRYNKQIAKVEDIRTQIQGEERKLTYKKPYILYSYK